MTAERLVAAAYVVVFLAVLVYVAIIALKLARLERTAAELERRASARVEEEEPDREAAGVG